MPWVVLAVAAAGLLAWVWLVLFRGSFWRTSHSLPEVRSSSEGRGLWPSVWAVVPARDEATVLPEALPYLLGQDYPGPFHVVLVDDESGDGTGAVARELARQSGYEGRLTVVRGRPLPPGWKGKVWALAQGVDVASPHSPDFLLFTDADIRHPPDGVRRLVAKATAEDLDLVSLMARLRVETWWDRLLVPAFVYFFAKLYPFRWVSDPRRRTAGAAGGCVLVRREALERAGGMASIAAALIDDCALARAVKDRGRPDGGRVWLGFGLGVESVRRYRRLGRMWDTVARSAYTQLRHSPLLLAATVAGMALLYLGPPLTAAMGLWGLAAGWPGAVGWGTAALGLGAWGLMAASYVPVLRWSGLRGWLSPLLPVAGLLYTAMTVDSALRSWRGRGGSWKGRAYGAPRG